MTFADVDVDVRVHCDECGEFLDDDSKQVCGKCFLRLKEKLDEVDVEHMKDEINNLCKQLVKAEIERDEAHRKLDIIKMYIENFPTGKTETMGDFDSWTLINSSWKAGCEGFAPPWRERRLPRNEA